MPKAIFRTQAKLFWIQQVFLLELNYDSRFYYSVYKIVLRNFLLSFHFFPFAFFFFLEENFYYLKTQWECDPKMERKKKKKSIFYVAVP